MDYQYSSNSAYSLNQPRTGLFLSGGLEYFNKKYFNISSNLSYYRLGGKEPMQFSFYNGNPVSVGVVEAGLDYISLNSTIDIKIPVGKSFYPFISVGPRIDYLVSQNHPFHTFVEPHYLTKTTYGLLGGAGLRYQVSKWQLGLRADYLLNFNKLAVDNPASSLTIHSFLVSATAGYRIKEPPAHHSPDRNNASR